MRVVCIVILLASFVWDVFSASPWLAIVPGLTLAAAVGVFGYFEGSDAMRKAFEAELVTCVGGPFDGTRLPRPPVPDDAEDVRIRIAEFPEGAYHLEEDRLVWSESE